MAPATKPFRLGALTWPVTARQWQALSDMVEDIYQRLKEGVANTSGLVFTVLTTGFSIGGGNPNSKTLTVVGDATVSGTSSGTNTGDQTITLTGDVTGSGTGSFVTAIGTGVIVNADINASAAIVDTKLATIATAGKVSNSATTATALDVNDAIVARDSTGGFASGAIAIVGAGTGAGSAFTIANSSAANKLLVQDNGIIIRTIDATTTWKEVQRAASTIGFLGNNSDYFLNYQTATQRVLIGGSSTFGSKFGVNGNTSIGAAYSDSAAPTSGLVVEGVVGIGTLTPAAKLAINGGLHVGGDSDPGDNNLLVDGTTTASGGVIGALTGNASTATTLQTARNINGVSFNGSANITITAAADTLTGTTLAALSGVNLTALNATNIASGTLADARLSSKVPLDDVAEAISGVWDFSNGLKERGRAFKMGEWTAVAYTAGDFTGSGSMVWTVEAGDVLGFSYTIVSGATMIVSLRLSSTTTSGTASNVLNILIPGGFTAAQSVNNPTAVLADAGVATTGRLFVTSGATTIGVARSDAANFTLGTNATQVYAEIAFPIQV